LKDKVNPDLVVEAGAVVEIILVNGDGVQHNLALPDFGQLSEDVLSKDQETRLVFKADKEGTFPYYCEIPGHRQAGMEGKLIVGQPSEELSDLPSISRAAVDLPGPITRTGPEHVRVDLETTEVVGRLADGTSYTYWTFNDLVPGPFIRVRVGDTVEVHLKNSAGSTMMHSVDFHAVTGPGGGAVATQTKPGEETQFTFQAINPGLYVYHCATPMVAHHIANGMYGLILVEPEGGLPPVDREFYVMQGEIYTAEPLGQKGAATFSQESLLDENPEYFVLNGASGALTEEHPLQAEVGETVRIFFGVGGPNFTSSFHVIGEIFDRVYDQASLTSQPLTDVQTTIVPTGGAAVVEFTLQVPGRYILVDHSLSRLERGLAGFLMVEGDPAPEIFDGEATPGSGH
jgi:nitrite reductase (NO-forming)